MTQKLQKLINISQSYIPGKSDIDCQILYGPQWTFAFIYLCITLYLSFVCTQAVPWSLILQLIAQINLSHLKLTQ